MSSQHQNKTPQPTPGHSRDYSQVANDDLVVLTDDLTDTEHEMTVEKARRQEEAEKKERECEEAERRQREEEEVQWKKVADEEAKRQRQRAAEEAEKQRQRAQARQDEAVQRLSGVVYDVNTAQRVPGTSVVVTTTRWPPCTCCIVSLTAEEHLQLDAGRGSGGTLAEESRDREFLRREEEEDEVGREDEEEPATPHKGPLEAGVSSWWTEWEQEWQLQAAERYVAAHEKAATAFKRMARAAEQMVVAAERTADEWALYCAWAEWAEMRRREDVREARMAELECTGGGWKRPQSEAEEDKNKEVDEGVEGDNEEEEEVGGEKEGGEEQEGDGGQVMEE
ncbi:hypothetical protein M404DRAFT_24411 [Pisolithus tinctorius Marx 270]|uniref:Uncharacterized protein n=1 Tax=Pisolithus tinctorius Marx 270 TaxID=870435 RepID=A0A0C3KAT2_PISTI|nr:hypothetical protein M404DRAFT_24411 [Pisolithus tinctorius Marx 270]